MLSYKTTGSFKNLDKFLSAMQNQKSMFAGLDEIAQRGVSALEAATPIDSGLAAGSWGYEINITKTGCFINWTNSDVENGFPVAIMLQLGHASKNGGYVQGTDYINPALRPVFDDLADAAWKVVTSA